MSARVRSLILAQLVSSAAFSCKKTETITTIDPPPSTTTPTIATATTSAPEPIPTPSTTETTAPSTSSSVKKIVIPLTVSAKPKLDPGRCITAADCAGGGSYCEPSGLPNTPGTCRYHVMRGRPLVVGGQAHLASASVEHALVDAAREEHASIAAFARTICELMSLGAPTWLLAKTSAALADEIQHTEKTFDAIERRTNLRPSLGALPEATAPIARSREDFFRDVFRGGAIGETLAAARAEVDRMRTDDEDLRALFEMLVVDESRHAALAFETLRWMLEKNPSLARTRDEEIAHFQASASIEDWQLLSPLFDVLA